MPGKKLVNPIPPSARIVSRTERVTQRLLEAATQLFMEKGYDATSMTEIATRAHASKETIYRHFPAKDDLFRAVVVRRAEMMSEALAPALLTDAPPETALTAFGELALQRMTSTDSLDFHRVLGMARERVPEVLELYRASGPFRLRDALALYLKQQVKAGRLRPLDPLVAARQFFDLAASEMMISAHFSGRGSPNKAAIRQRVREAIDCFLHGYAN